MRTVLSLALLLAVIPGAHAAWELDRFMISAWGAPDNDTMARAYVAAGINTVMAKSAALDLCRAHGLRAIVTDATPEFAAQHTADPAVWGWFVQDEPKAEEFPKVGERVAQFHAADANHPAYVNLMAWMDLGQYLSTVKPRFLSYDYYQWWWGPQHYCWRLDAHRAAALKAGLPLICWIEANADPRYEWGKPGAGYLPDNAAKLRQSVYLALAYGVRGIQWFTGGLILRPGADGQPVLSQSGADITVLNRELQALGPTLLQLRSEQIVHTEPLPPHTTAAPESLWVQPRGRDLTLGLFTGPAGKPYLMLVNRELNRERPANLWFQRPVKAVSRFDCATSTWQPLALLPAATGQSAVRLSLPPGGGALLRVDG